MFQLTVMAERNMSKHCAKSHEENRTKICLFCLKKGVELKNLIPSMIHILKDKTNYDSTDIRLPCVVCKKCKVYFYKAVRDDGGTKLQVMLPEYSKFTHVKRPLRNNAYMEICLCTLCTLARATPFTTARQKNSDQKKKLGSKLKNNASVYKNVKSLIDIELTSKQKEHLLSDLIKDVCTSPAINKVRKNELSLSQSHGKPLRVALNPQPQKQPKQISAEDVAKIRTKYPLSQSVVLGLIKIHFLNFDKFKKYVIYHRNC